MWRRAAESAKEACARFAAEQGLNGDVLPDLEALVASQTALRKVSPSLFAAPSWWRPADTSGAKPIVAVVRGRQEFGPRALGRRSLLAVPDSVDARNRLNRLKRRQWYRPVAPMVAEDGGLPGVA